MVLPDSLRGRFLHTTTLLHTDDTQKHLVVHGGLDETSEDNAYLDTLVPVADTTIIEIGKTMHECLCVFIQGIMHVCLYAYHYLVGSDCTGS